MERINVRCAGRHCQNQPVSYCECGIGVTYFCEQHAGAEKKGHKNCKLQDVFKDVSADRQEIFFEIRSRIQSIDSSETQMIKAAHKITDFTRARSSDVISRCTQSRNTFQDLFSQLRSTPYIFHKDLDLLRSNPNSVPGVNEAKALENLFKRSEILSNNSDTLPPDNVNLTCFKIKYASLLQEKKIRFLKELSTNIGSEEITAVAAKISLNLIVYGTKNSKVYLIKQNFVKSGLIIEDSGRESVKDNSVKAIAITKDGRNAVIGFQKGEIILFKINERVFIVLHRGDARICSICCSSNGNIAAFDFTSNTIILKNSQTFKIKGENDKARENVVKFTKDGSYVITSNKFKNIVRFSMIDNSQCNLFESDSEINFIEVSKLQPLVAICYSRTVDIIDYTISNKSDPVFKCKTSKDIALVSFTKKNPNLCFVGYSKGVKQVDLNAKNVSKIKTILDLICYIERFPELKKFTWLFQP